MKRMIKKIGVSLISAGLLISCTGEKKVSEITPGTYLPLSSQELNQKGLNIDSQTVYYTDSETPYRVYRANKNTDGSAEIQTGSFSLEVSPDKKKIKFSEMSLKAGTQSADRKIDEFTSNDLGMLSYQNPQAQTREYVLKSSLYKLQNAIYADLSQLDEDQLKIQSKDFLEGNENNDLSVLSKTKENLQKAKSIYDESQDQSIRMSLLEGGLIQISIQNKKGNAIATEPVVFYYQKASPELLKRINQEFMKDLERMAKVDKKEVKEEVKEEVQN